MKQSEHPHCSPISGFLFDRLSRSYQNKLSLHEQFIFSFLFREENFEIIFKILYSAFQSDLIQNPSDFTSYIPPNVDSYPDSLEFIVMSTNDYEKHQKEVEKSTHQFTESEMRQNYFQNQLIVFPIEETDLQVQVSQIEIEVKNLQDQIQQAKVPFLSQLFVFTLFFSLNYVFLFSKRR
jgi:hypothetical protein